jgi:Ca-activated chloride channel family protein
MTFDDPLALILLLAVPLLLLLKRAQRRHGTIGYPTTGPLADLPRSARMRFAAALPWARGLALTLAVFAVADPRWGLELSRAYQEGVAIVVVVDTSSSMLAEDLQITAERASRLDVVKATLRDFVNGRGPDSEGREGDALGLVSFARFADTVSPLTLDHAAFLATLDAVEIIVVPQEDGTAIGDAMVMATDLLRDAEAESKVMVVLTDGNNNAGSVHPMDAAWVAKTFDITVHTIGAGGRDAAPTTTVTADDGTRTMATPGFLDQFLLKEIADTTGGKFFRATDGRALADIYSEIDKLETSTQVVEQYQRSVQIFPAFLGFALLLLLLEAALGNTVLRTTP